MLKRITERIGGQTLRFGPERPITRLGLGIPNQPLLVSTWDITESRRHWNSPARGHVKLLLCRPPPLPPGRQDSDPFLQQLVPLVSFLSRSTYSATHCWPLRIRCSLPPQFVRVSQTCSTCCYVCLLVLLLLKLAEITKDHAHDCASVCSSSEQSLIACLALFWTLWQGH
jgi:hypothetical protein